MAGSTFIGEVGNMVLSGTVVTMKRKRLGLSPHGQRWQQGGSGAAASPAQHPPSMTTVCTDMWGYQHACWQAGLPLSWASLKGGGTWGSTAPAAIPFSTQGHARDTCAG